MSEQSDEPVFVTIEVVCRNPECSNADFRIPLEVPMGCRVACGVCGDTLVEESLDALRLGGWGEWLG